MNEQNPYNKCEGGDCPKGIENVRKIGLTPQEKRAIFHSVLNLMQVENPALKDLSREESFKAVVSN